MLVKKANDKTVLTDTSYSFGKKLVQIWIPAVSSAYFALSQIWGWPYTEQVVGTLAVVATFLGIVLHVSSSNFDQSGAGFDGNAVVMEDDGKGVMRYSLELNGNPADLKDKDKVTFKVVNAPTEDTPSKFQ